MPLMITRQTDASHFFETILHLVLLANLFVKQLISILFLLIYVNVAFGISVDCHYCGGKLANLKICGVSVKESCPMKSMPLDCCKEKSHYCKTDSHKTPAVANVTAPETSLKIPVFLIDSYNWSLVTAAQSVRNYLRSRDINQQADCPLFISNRVFRI